MATVIAFLGKALGPPLKWLLGWVLTEVVTRVAQSWREYTKRKAFEKDLAEAKAKVMLAQTPEEQEKAFAALTALLNSRS